MKNNHVLLNSISNVVELITAFIGPMFAEKTSELFRRLRRHARAGQKVILFRPSIDTRGKIRPQTHDGEGLHIAKFRGEIIRISSSKEILSLALEKKAKVVGIDEAQFFPGDLIKVLVKLYEHSITVYLSALDTDYRGKNFTTVSKIMRHPLVDVKKLTAICNSCRSSQGVYTIKKNVQKHSKRIEIGGKSKYQPACHTCRRRIIRKQKLT